MSNLNSFLIGSMFATVRFVTRTNLLTPTRTYLEAFQITKDITFPRIN